MPFVITANLAGLKAFREALAQQLANPSASGPIRECLNSQWPYTYLQAMRERFDRLSRGGGEWPPLKPSTIQKRRGKHQRELGMLSVRLAKLTPEQRKDAQKEIRQVAKQLLGLSSSSDPAEAKRQKAWANARARAQVYRRYRKAGNTIRTRKAIANAANVTILRDTGTLFRALSMGAAGNVVQPVAGGVAVGIGGSAPHNDDGKTIGGIARIHQEGLGHAPVRRIVVEPAGETRGRLAAQLQTAVNESVRLAQQQENP